MTLRFYSFSLATTANDLGLFFSSAKTKVMVFNISLQSQIFHLGKQPIETIKHYKYLGVTIDARLSFTKYLADTKHKIYSRLNMIKIISTIKIGLNTKMLVTLYKALIQSIILYAASVLLLAAPSAIHNLEQAQRTCLLYVLGLPPGSSSALLHQESGILPLGQLVRMVTAKYIVRTASNPVPNITRIQTEIHKDPRVHQAISWSMKAAWPQKDIGIPQIQPPVSQESPP